MPTNFSPYLKGERRAYVKVNGKNQFFPRRELQTVEYSIEETYQGLYQELRDHLGKGTQREEQAAKELRRRVDLRPVRPLPLRQRRSRES
jgi:hypothetical protein